MWNGKVRLAREPGVAGGTQKNNDGENAPKRQQADWTPLFLFLRCRFVNALA
jgi:hypothetical protein